MSWFVILLFRYCHFLVILMRYSKCGPPWSELILPLTQRNISTRCRVLFHILLHPVWELLFISEPKPNSFSTVRLEARLYVIAWLSWVLRSAAKSVSFRHTENMNRLLESSWTLLVKNFYIIIILTVSIVSRIVYKR